MKEKPRALVWLHDVVPDKQQRNSPLLRSSGGAVVHKSKGRTASILGQEHRKGSIYEALNDVKTLETIEAEEKNMGAAGILTMKLELFEMFIKSLLNKIGPIVMVMEDLQWMDLSSWKLLRRLCTIQNGVMMVCTTRPVSRNQILDYTWVVNKATNGKKEVRS